MTGRGLGSFSPLGQSRPRNTPSEQGIPQRARGLIPVAACAQASAQAPRKQPPRVSRELGGHSAASAPVKGDGGLNSVSLLTHSNPEVRPGS